MSLAHRLDPSCRVGLPDRVLHACVILVALLAAGCGGGDATPSNIDLGGGIVMTPDGQILIAHGGASNADRPSDTPAAP